MVSPKRIRYLLDRQDWRCACPECPFEDGMILTRDRLAFDNRRGLVHARCAEVGVAPEYVPTAGERA